MPRMFRDFPNIPIPGFCVGDGWEDASVDHDATAHAEWTPDGRGDDVPRLEVWVEPENEADRNPGAARFLLRWFPRGDDPEGWLPLYEGDDESKAALAAIVARVVSG